jgi:hypothetical protein
VEPPREEKGKVQYSIEGWVTTQTLHSIADNRTVAYLYRRGWGPSPAPRAIALQNISKSLIR